MRKWMRIAHRGASAYAPENTAAAFKKALEMGVDGVELDVHLTADGQLAVIHDGTLDRTTDMSGKVAEHTLEEIRQADAGSWFGEAFRGQKVPTLEEVLELVPLETLIFIEIKVSEAAVPSAKMAAALNRMDQVVFISFYPEALEAVYRHDSRFASALLVAEPPVKDGGAEENAQAMLERSRSLGTSALGVYWKMASRELVETVHRQGGSIWAWAPDDPQIIAGLVDAGIDGIASNHPDRLRAD